MKEKTMDEEKNSLGLKAHPDKSKHKSLITYIKNKKYIPYIIAIVLLAMITTTIDVIVPKILGKVIDGGITESNISGIYRYGNTLIFLGLASIVLIILEIVVATVFETRVFTKIRKDFFKKINKLDFDQLNYIGAESAVTRVTNDLNKVSSAFLIFISAALFSPVLLVFSIYMCYNLNPKLTFIILATIPFFIVLGIVIPKIMKKFMEKVQLQLDTINRVVSENVKGIRVVKTYNAEKLEFSKFKVENEDLRKNTLKVVIIMNIIAPVFIIILNTALIFIIKEGSVSLIQEKMLLGQLMAFITYVGQLILAIALFTIFFIQFARAIPSYRRIFEVINSKPEGLNKNSDFELNDISIEFKNVSFKFAEHKHYSLKNVSFKIYQGQTLGIVGPTGAGKTLIINLLLGMYSKYEGDILVAGKNIKNLRLDVLRRKMSLVPQKDQLFKGTIKENINLGEIERTDDEILKALKKACAYEFVSKYSDGIYHELSINGNNLSGGQKQRIAIARAIARKAPIIIMDSASSALDNITERKIQENLKNESEDITQIVISQRLTSVENADKILVLKEGEVEAFGDKNTVKFESEFYSKLLEMQGGNDEN